jgi:hypothetical protein
MLDKGDKIQKIKVEAALELVDGSSVMGNFFISPGGRLSDILNDSREFLPVETIEGATTVVRKSAIVRATPLQQSEDHQMNASDPYQLFGVTSDVAQDELKARYHDMVRNAHPDRLFSMGLPAPFIDFANSQLARINNAYQKICQDRQFTRDSSTSAPPPGCH